MKAYPTPQRVITGLTLAALVLTTGAGPLASTVWAVPATRSSTTLRQTGLEESPEQRKQLEMALRHGNAPAAGLEERVRYYESVEAAHEDHAELRDPNMVPAGSSAVMVWESPRLFDGLDQKNEAGWQKADRLLTEARQIPGWEGLKLEVLTGRDLRPRMAVVLADEGPLYEGSNGIATVNILDPAIKTFNDVLQIVLGGLLSRDVPGRLEIRVTDRKVFIFV